MIFYGSRHCRCAWSVVACSTYPCLFVSCEQRFVRQSLSSLCLCQRHSQDVSDCVVRVIPLHDHHQQQQQQQQPVTCADCLRPRSACHCVAGGRRRRRRTAACRGQCGQHVRRAVSSAARRCRNGCLLYTSPSPRDRQKSRMPSSA